MSLGSFIGFFGCKAPKKRVNRGAKPIAYRIGIDDNPIVEISDVHGKHVIIYCFDAFVACVDFLLNFIHC